MVVLCTVQLDNRHSSLLILCRMRGYVLVSEYSESRQFQALLWKRASCPLNLDANNWANKISLSFDQFSATLFSAVYLVLDSDVCLRLELKTF